MVEPELEQLRDRFEDAHQKVLLMVAALARRGRGRKLFRQAGLEVVEDALGQNPVLVPAAEEVLEVGRLAGGPHAGGGDSWDVVMGVLVDVEGDEDGAAGGAVGEGHGAIVDDEEELARLYPQPLGRGEKDLQHALVPPLHQRLHELQHPQVIAELLGPPARARAPLRVARREDRHGTFGACEVNVVACHLRLEHQLWRLHEDQLRPAVLVAGDGNASTGAGLHDEVDGDGVPNLLQELDLLLKHLVLQVLEQLPAVTVHLHQGGERPDVGWEVPGHLRDKGQHDRLVPLVPVADGVNHGIQLPHHSMRAGMLGGDGGECDIEIEQRLVDDGHGDGQDADFPDDVLVLLRCLLRGRQLLLFKLAQRHDRAHSDLQLLPEILHDAVKARASQDHLLLLHHCPPLLLRLLLLPLLPHLQLELPLIQLPRGPLQGEQARLEDSVAQHHLLHDLRLVPRDCLHLQHVLVPRHLSLLRADGVGLPPLALHHRLLLQ
eukprot:749300-Hanusia_phi.AAC.1